MATQLPPGQYVTEKWPVLHSGGIPRFDPARWDFQILGEVETPVRLSYKEFMTLPIVKMTADIHCVTAWSRLGVVFEGVATATVLEMAKIKPTAQAAMIHAEQGYETNMPLSDLLAADALFAYRADGQPLSPEHGWPLRLVISRLYFWKSAKWVRSVEVLSRDRPGFWERNGYHMRGDPWREQRYSDS